MRKRVKRVDKLRGEDGTKFLADGFGAAESVHGLHLRVPAFDAVVEIEGQDADVDGFDDVFVELLETLELADFFFEPRVEAGVLEGDADVAGQRFQQFNVFAREEVAADGAAQADDGDGAAVRLRPERDTADSSSGRAGPRCAAGAEANGRRPGRFPKRCASGHGRGRSPEIPEPVVSCAASGLGGQTMGGCQLQTAGFFGFRREKRPRAPPASVRGSRSTMDSSSALRSVSELKPAAELDQRLAIVVAMAVEKRGQPSSESCA